MIRELQKGDRLTADYIREIVRTVRRGIIRAGHGLRLTETPNGAVISLADSHAPARRADRRPMPFDVRPNSTGLEIFLSSGYLWSRNGNGISADPSLTPAGLDPDWYSVPGAVAGVPCAVYAYLNPDAAASAAWPHYPDIVYVLVGTSVAGNADGRNVCVAYYDGQSVVQYLHGTIVDSFDAGDADIADPSWGGGPITDPTKSVTRLTTGFSLHGFKAGAAVESMDDGDLIPLRRVVSSVPTLLWVGLAALAEWIKTWLLSNGSGGGIDDDLIDEIIDETDGKYWHTGDTDGSTTRGRFIYDNTPSPAIDILQRIVNSQDGNVSVDAHQRTLIDAGGATASLGWDARVAYDPDAAPSIDWGARVAYDAAGSVSIDWDTRLLHGEAGSTLDWGYRQLLNSGGHVSIDWDTRILYDSSGPALDYYSAHELYGDWVALADFKALALHVGTEVAAADWQSCDVVTDVAVDAQGHVTSVTKKTVEYLGKAPY